MKIRDALKGTLSRIGHALRGFSPSCFDDPMAERTAWSGMSDNEETDARRLVTATSNTMEFEISKFGWSKPLFLAGFGLIALIGGTQGLLMGDLTGIVALPLGIVFVLFAVNIAKKRLRPKTFDIRRGIYWEGEQPPTPDIAAQDGERTFCRLENIYAVQILCHWASEHNGVSSFSYRQYELNLVLDDADRIHVVAYQDRERLREDGQQLADFLGVPLWDATRFGMGPR